MLQMRRTATSESLYKIKNAPVKMWKIFKDYSSHDPDHADAEEDFKNLGIELNYIKKLNQELEKSIFNEYLDELFAAISSYVTGSQIIGAGSGGFILGWLRKGSTKQQVADALKVPFPNAE